MTRIALIAFLAGIVAAPAIAATTLEVTVSDRGQGSTHSPEVQRIFDELAAEGE